MFAGAWLLVAGALLAAAVVLAGVVVVTGDSSASVWNDLRLAGHSALADGVRIRAAAAAVVALLGCAAVVAAAGVMRVRHLAVPELRFCWWRSLPGAQPCGRTPVRRRRRATHPQGQ